MAKITKRPSSNNRVGRARIIVAILSITLATVASLGTTFLYGYLFQHDRYWNGTVKRVRSTEANMLESMVALKGFEDALIANPELLEPIKGHLAVRIERGTETIFSNHIEGRKLQRRVPSKTIRDLNVTIEYYSPPSFITQFSNWIVTPKIWFTKSGDFITIPFMAFFLIYLISIISIGWILKARHLSDEVLTIIRK